MEDGKSFVVHDSFGREVTLTPGDGHDIYHSEREGKNSSIPMGFSRENLADALHLAIAPLENFSDMLKCEEEDGGAHYVMKKLLADCQERLAEIAWKVQEGVGKITVECANGYPLRKDQVIKARLSPNRQE